MRSIVAFLFVALVLGCEKEHRESQITSSKTQAQSLLDEILASSEASNLMAHAECDLSEDKWTNEPWRHNVSRSKREIAASQQLLARIESKLKKMTVADLISSLKVVSYDEMMTNRFSGVAHYTYRHGNQMILQEVISRPKIEIEDLRNLRDDRIVFEGDQGPGDTLNEVIDQRILKKQP